MTSARIVTPGQAMAMIPTMMPRTPSRINEVDVDLNMTGIPLFWLCRAVPFWTSRGLAGDVEVVLDLEDATGHPGGADHRVVLGPGADVPGQRHGVPAGVHRDVAVIWDQRVPVPCVLDEQGDVERVRVVGDLDVVLDVAHAGQPGDSRLGRAALRRLPPGAAGSSARCH